MDNVLLWDVCVDVWVEWWCRRGYSRVHGVDIPVVSSPNSTSCDNSQINDIRKRHCSGLSSHTWAPQECRICTMQQPFLLQFIIYFQSTAFFVHFLLYMFNHTVLLSFTYLSFITVGCRICHNQWRIQGDRPQFVQYYQNWCLHLLNGSLSRKTDAHEKYGVI